MTMTNDREDFEDEDLIARYLHAMPRPDTGYRAALRARLTNVAPARRGHLRLWRWSLPAGAFLAAVITLVLLLVPVLPDRGKPLSPEAVLARAVSASAHPTVYSASSAMSFTVQEGDAPAAATKDIGTERIVSTWAVRDMTHWRVDIHILQPALQSEHQVAVANGRTVVWYSGLTRTAELYALRTPWMGESMLSMFQGANGLALGQTLAQYLQVLNNKKTHMHARVVGQATLLGRTADVVEVWPVEFTVGACANAQQCDKREVGHGYDKIWIDREYGIVLRDEEHGLLATDDFRDFAYRLTSVTFGRGPTASQLSYRSPAQPVSAGNQLGGGFGFGTAGPGAHWRVPVPFMTAGPPLDAKDRTYIFAASGQGGTSSVEALYLLHWTSTNPAAPPQGPFVYVQEQIRYGGLPAALRRGARHVAGRCTVYTGTYPDGLYWMALARGKVSLQAVANRLDQHALVRWAATQICR